MALLTRFFRWIGGLMRRRHFVATTTGISPPPPPPPGTVALQFNLAANSQYVPLISF